LVRDLFPGGDETTCELLVEVCAAEEVAASAANKFAAAVLEAGGAVGAEDAVVFLWYGATLGSGDLFCGGGGVKLHCDRVSQPAGFSRAGFFKCG
jgi:hypothetical protein